MADQPVRGSSSPGSPGLSGAIKDAIAAVVKATAPKSITQRGSRVDADVAANDGSNDPTGRMRNAQSSDRDNGYSN